MKQQTEEVYRTLVEHSLQGLGIVQNGRIVFANSTLAQLTGYTIEELHALSPEEFQAIFHTEDQALLMDLWPYHDHQITPAHHEVRIYHRNGSLRLVVLYTGSIKYQQKPALQFACIDNTEHEQTEEQILQTDRLAALGRLSAALAHEINNPLQIIQGYLELILDFSLEPGEESQYLHLIRQEIKRLNEINRRFLNFATGSEHAMRQHIPVTKLVEEVLILTDAHLQHRKIRVVKEWLDNPIVVAMPDQLKQVFLNLVINAVEHSSERGALYIAIRSETGQAIITFTNKDGAISPEILSHLFEPFYTSKHGQGHGLGLWVSHNLILQHGGSLQAENLADNQGVMFTVRLPTATRVRSLKTDGVI